MYNFLVKKGTTISFLVGILVIAIFLISGVSGLGDAGYEAGTDLVEIAKNKAAEAKIADRESTLTGYEDMNFFNSGISLTLFLIAFALIAILGGFLLGLIRNPKQVIKSLGLLAGLIVLFFIMRAVAPAEIGAKLASVKETFKITEGVSGLISGGIATTLFLIVAAAVIMVLFEIRNAFK